jgi:hypothetical protein
MWYEHNKCTVNIDNAMGILESTLEPLAIFYQNKNICMKNMWDYGQPDFIKYQKILSCIYGAQ